MSVAKMKAILMRIVATFAATGLGTIGAGSIVGIDVLTAVLIAGIGGVAVVVEGLARAYVSDGVLTMNEINGVFSKVNDDVTT
jgi:hypothetical protein